MSSDPAPRDPAPTMIMRRTVAVGSATIIALVAAMFTAPGAAKAQGPVAGYAFDETSGTSAADISGNGTFRLSPPQSLSDRSDSPRPAPRRPPGRRGRPRPPRPARRDHRS